MHELNFLFEYVYLKILKQNIMCLTFLLFLKLLGGMHVLFRIFGIHKDSNDEPVQTENLCEDEDEDHPHEESGLLGGAAHPGLPRYADRVAGRQARQAHRQTRS